MLNQDDIKQINDAVEKSLLPKIAVEMGKVIEQNVAPAIDVLQTDVNSLKSDVSGLKSDVSDLKTDVAYIKNQTITKSYLDDKLADLEGGTVARQRKEDQKVNLLIQILENKKVLQETDVKQLQEFQIFPVNTGKH